MMAPIEEKVSAAAFAASLPDEYRERFGPAEIAAHAHVYAGRAPGVAAAGAFPWHQAGLTGICVVVEDRPGLLSLISRALTECGFDVESAEAYCREGSPKVAVDSFWLRDPSGAIGGADIAAFVELLNGVLSGLRPETPPKPFSVPPGARHTTVRFLEQKGGALSVLEVETDDRSGLLYAITRALHGAGVQIVSSQIRTTGARVLDRFAIAELDGSPVGDERRFAIQIAVLSALEGSAN